MAPVTVDLEARAVATFSAAGTATASIGPRNQREVWSPLVASVSASTNVKEASCKIYAGWDASQPNFVDSTLSGSTGDSSSNIAGRTVRAGDQVFAVWTGGDVGAQARLNVTGSKVMNSGGAPDWVHR
jgi:hypothetical protein